ncbi:MAG: hypothetical protein ACI4KA_01805 [Oscillospiraceae bacterium]
MQDQYAKKAREFLGNECEGNEICCCCGLPRATQLIKKVVKSKFTQMDRLILSPSIYICDSCIRIYDNSDMRFKIIYSEGGGYEVIGREAVLQILREPPECFVLSVPYSFKKHHWLYAGLSGREKAYIGTDDRTVEVDYSSFDVSDIIDTVQDMINYGIPRAEIVSGNYSIFTTSKYGTLLLRNEAKIEPLRAGGLIELIVKYTPARKEKLIYEREEDNPMLTESEMNAVNFLGSIASNSSYRKQNGIQFWQGYFKRRINRFKKYDAKIFASKLAESCGSPDGAYVTLIIKLSDEELAEMMTDIRNKTDLLVSIVYGDRLNKEAT